MKFYYILIFYFNKIFQWVPNIKENINIKQYLAIGKLSTHDILLLILLNIISPLKIVTIF